MGLSIKYCTEEVSEMIGEPRIILLDGEVNSAAAMNVVLKLLEMEKDSSTEEISLYINSPGGSIAAGLGIYDTINYINAPVSTVCYGMAASMGAFLLTCGVKGRRFALPHSTILIHQPLIQMRDYVSARQTDIQKQAEGLLKSRNKLEKIMAANTGKSIDEIHIACERDNWMSAEQALDYGIIDGILTK